MKYAIVTGGTRGIGSQICIDLLQKGYFVITNYSSHEEYAKIAENEFSKYSSNFSITKADQSSEKELKSFIEFIKMKTNVIHCIVCNTGLTIRKTLVDISSNEWEKMFQVNVHSHVYLIKYLDDLIQDNSKIIFIGSLLAIHPHSTSLGYAVTKAAIHALALNLVKDFADRKVTVNTIAPGFVETDWQKNKPLEIRQNINNKTALKRFATIQEISMVCMMIVDNDFINGATLQVDGGYNYK
ncbi:SDR family NAD(P)-dependent oxidoreductase [Flavobacterium aquidurense]|uniref:SDR family NAD(P)-dependent oxidoreductase n=1 Tax=Flavobacterium aquidurense TaxID=362413 RepID=UPI00375634C7